MNTDKFLRQQAESEADRISALERERDELREALRERDELLLRARRFIVRDGKDEYTGINSKESLDLLARIDALSTIDRASGGEGEK